MLDHGGANLRGNEDEHVGRRAFLRSQNTAGEPQIGEMNGKPRRFGSRRARVRRKDFVLLHRGVSRCTNGRLRNRPRQNMFMNSIDKWRGFLLDIRCGLGGCNRKSPFRLAKRASAMPIFVSLMPQYANLALGSSEGLPHENHPGIMHGGADALSGGCCACR